MNLFILLFAAIFAIAGDVNPFLAVAISGWVYVGIPHDVQPVSIEGLPAPEPSTDREHPEDYDIRT